MWLTISYNIDSISQRVLYVIIYRFCYRCATGMAEKLREAAARGDVARVKRLLDENVKPLPDEV